MKEYENVEKYVSDLMQYDLVIEAIKELINVINQDDETNQPMVKITAQFTENKGWAVYAYLNDDNFPNRLFKYAMYITERGDIIADGA
jgi:hypothetical protein